MRKNGTATITDVAQLAGVSKATVSNVINHKGSVSKKTIARVREACDALRYSPSFAASTLASGRTGIFGLYLCDENDTDDFGTPVYMDLMKGLLLESYKTDLRMLIYYKADRQEMEHILSGKGPLDGAIILRPSQNDFRISTLSQRAIQTVLIGKPYESQHSDILYVDTDVVGMTREIMEFLITRGKRHFLFFNSRADYTVSQDRHLGFYSALAAYHIDPDSSMMVNITDPQKGMRAITESFMQTNPEDSAIITTFPGTTSLIRQCAAAGDHGTVIFDFDRVFVDYQMLGRAAFRLLQKAIEGQEDAKSEILPYAIRYEGLIEAAR